MWFVMLGGAADPDVPGVPNVEPNVPDPAAAADAASNFYGDPQRERDPNAL